MAQDEGKVMVQFHYEGEPPDPAAVAARFSIDEAAIDPAFGVIVTDDVEKLCTVLVPAEIAKRMLPQLGGDDTTEGSFSSPRIAPFGPPEGDEDGD